MHPLLVRLLPALAPVSIGERVRAGVGALIGILLTGLVTRLALGDSAGVPLLIAPMGASAVLLFAVPASPLAQPWSILGGNLVAGLVGVTAAIWITSPFLAAATAVGVALAIMLSLRCVHPPSGAVALTAVLGGPAVTAAGYGFVLWPVLLNSAIILAVALVFNPITGRRYPHLASPAPAAQAPPAQPTMGVSRADVAAALSDYGELLDVDPADLADLVQRAQIRAFQRRSGEVTCADIMTRDALAVSPGTPISEAFDLLRSGRIKVLPVTTETARVVGVLTQTDLLDKVEWGNNGPRLGFLRRARQSLQRGRALDAVVGEIMTTNVHTVTPDTRIATLAPLMAQSGLHHIPVVDANGQLAGLISQADLINALIHEHDADGIAPVPVAAV